MSLNKVNALPLTITTDSNGDGSVTFKFHRDVILHSVVAHKAGSIDRREFFRLIAYGRNPDSTDQVSEGQESSPGGSGPGNGYFKSTIIPGGSELYIAIQAGTDNAAANYKIHALFEVIP